MVNASGSVSLENMKISGDLILAPGVTGPVTLTNVTIAGAIRNFSDVEPTLVSDETHTPETPEEPTTPEEPQTPEDPQTPVTPGIDPTTVYTPGTKTGETIAYSGLQIPVYAGAGPAGALSRGVLLGRGRLVYAGSAFDTRFGIDVSAYQNRASANETIDWEAVANDGVDFAMVRIGLRGTPPARFWPTHFISRTLKGP